MVQDLGGHRAQQQPAKDAAAVSGHHDQIDITARHLRADAVRCVAGGHYVLDRQVAKVGSGKLRKLRGHGALFFSRNSAGAKNVNSGA